MIYFEKSQPSPVCLQNKTTGDYKCGDVLIRLKNDFRNKCYICEFKEPVTINIEHFRPHMGNVTLKYDWNNLFWSCSHCNNVKLDNFTDILDCTDINENIDAKIKISIRPFPKEKVIIEALDNTQPTLSTVNLLRAVYNGTTKLKTIEASNLRNKILKEIKEFQNYLFYFYDESFNEDDRLMFLAHIKKHLSKASNFTAFKRWIILENEVLKNDFEQYFD